MRLPESWRDFQARARWSRVSHSFGGSLVVSALDFFRDDVQQAVNQVVVVLVLPVVFTHRFVFSELSQAESYQIRSSVIDRRPLRGGLRSKKLAGLLVSHVVIPLEDAMTRLRHQYINAQE